MPTIDLDEYEIDRSTLKRLPQELCDAQHVIPVAIAGTSLVVAMTNPDDRDLIQKLELHAGINVEPVIAAREAIDKALRKYRNREN